jgi:conjugative transfer signal peptidase TraF
MFAITHRMTRLLTGRHGFQPLGLSLRGLENCSRDRGNWVWVFLALGLGAGLGLGAHFFDFRINWTSSMPPGLYRESPARLKRGEIVLICLPEEIAAVGRQRRYLPLGDCPNGVSPVVKEIVATAGDEIELQDELLAVNGVVVDRTRLRSFDSLGRPMNHAQLGRRLVAGGEVWVLGNERSRSWDSRYFGAVPVGAIVASAKPVLTLDGRAD